MRQFFSSPFLQLGFVTIAIVHFSFVDGNGFRFEKDRLWLNVPGRDVARIVDYQRGNGNERKEISRNSQPRSLHSPSISSDYVAQASNLKTVKASKLTQAFLSESDGYSYPKPTGRPFFDRYVTESPEVSKDAMCFCPCPTTPPPKDDAAERFKPRPKTTTTTTVPPCNPSKGGGGGTGGGDGGYSYDRPACPTTPPEKEDAAERFKPKPKTTTTTQPPPTTTPRDDAAERRKSKPKTTTTTPRPRPPPTTPPPRDDAAERRKKKPKLPWCPEYGLVKDVNGYRFYRPGVDCRPQWPPPGYVPFAEIDKFRPEPLSVDYNNNQRQNPRIPKSVVDPSFIEQ